MASAHPLNQAVIAQALHDLHNGQLRRCKAMGFEEADLDALKQPALVSLLVNANVSWCSISVNREVFQRLLKQAQTIERDIAVVDRMLRLGGSSDLVGRYFGLTHQEVAFRREVLGLPKRKGRHAMLDEDQDAELWRRWRARQEDLPGQVDDAALLEQAMDLAEGMAAPLSVVWALLKQWTEQGLG